MVEDRDGALGRLRVGDRGADRRLKELAPDVLLQRRERLAAVARAHVGDVEHDAEPAQLGVQSVARELDDLERLLDALQREVLRLGRQQRVVGGDERVDGQQAERRRAVQEDQVIALAQRLERAPERQLAAHLAGEHELGLGEREVRGDDVVVDRLRRLGAAGEHVGDRRRGLGIDVEVVRQVALRIEIDGEHVEADAAQDVGQGPHRGGLAGAALLGEDCDRGAQGRQRLLGAERGGGRLGAQRRAIGEAQAVAADDDLVAVGEQLRDDALAVDEHAVEAAVVEHAHAVGLGDQHRMAARDGRILEAQVGRQAAADPHRVAGHGDRAHLAGVMEDEVAARCPRSRRGRRRSASPCVAVSGSVRWKRVLPANSEARVKLAPVAAGAGRKDIGSGHLQDVTTDLAAKRAGSGERS